MRAFPLVVACLAFPSLALACPQGLGGGVRIVFDDGAVSEITATELPAVVRERVTFDAQGDGFEIISLFGLYDLRSIDFDAAGELPQTEEASDYARIPPAPAPDQSVQGIIAQVTTVDGTFERRHDVLGGRLAQVDIGACSYQAFPVDLRVSEPDGNYRHGFLFLPLLGLTIQIMSEDPTDGFREYAALSITALDPAPDAGAPQPAPTVSK